jgi:AP-2 complex subunit alpha
VLPIHMTLFNDPLPLSAEDFEKRWQMLVAPGQESTICVIKGSPLSLDQAAQIFEKVLKFSRVEGGGSNCLQGAASFRTGATNPSGEKITLGCLIKIEVSGMTINITCRTVHAAATSALASSVKYMFSD